MHPLKALREYLELTQIEMADELGVVQSLISAVETGAQPCSREMGLEVLVRFRPQLGRLELTLENLLRGNAA